MDQDLTPRQVVNQRFALLPDFLTTRQVARILGVTPAAVYKRRERGSIPVSKVGTRLVFLRTILKSWTANQGL